MQYCVRNTVMKRMKKQLIRYIFLSAMCMMIAFSVVAQERTVQNRPYTDLRPFHFGILVGTHLQDLEFHNIGVQQVVNGGGTPSEMLISTDQDRWDAGFTVGVLGELRLNDYFAFRVAPALYFGTRHLTLRNHTQTAATGRLAEQQQELKTAYISTACDIIYAAQRFNNRRPYVMLGVNPMVNLSGKSQDYIKLKRYDLFLEAGIGCDFYLPFFKLRPELKFLYGLTNSLDTRHADELKDKAMRVYTNSVDRSHSKMIVLTFYFE